MKSIETIETNRFNRPSIESNRFNAPQLIEEAKGLVKSDELKISKIHDLAMIGKFAQAVVASVSLARIGPDLRFSFLKLLYLSALS